MSFSGPLACRHKKGWTVAIYDTSGEHVISGGVDGKVKVSNTFDDPCPLEHVIGEKINSMVCRGDTVVLATEGTHVHMIQTEDGLPDGVATRFTAEVNDVAANKDMNKLVSCSSDFMIKVVDFTNSEDREFVLEGHQAPVLSVAFDPLDIFVASSSCDGTIRIWRLDQRKEVKCIRALSPCSDPSLALSCCRLCWQATSGQFLAVPIDREVCLYERDSWEVLAYLRCPSITKPIRVCVSSPDGSRLAAGCADGWIVFWSIDDRQVLHRVKDVSESPTCSLSWHPHHGFSILVANSNGCIGVIRLPEPKTDGALSPRSMNALLGCDEDGDTDDLLRAAAAQAESSRLMDEDEVVRRGTGTTPDIATDDDDAHSIDLSRIKSGFMELDDADPDVPVIDDKKGAGSVAATPVENATENEVPLASRAAVQEQPRPAMRIQQPFQPGSMPLGFHERFMVWNRYGLVIQYRSTDVDPELEEPNDAERSSVGSIEVEFHDTSLHHSLRLSNTVGYTMADLSLTALLLASPGTHDPSLADDADAGEPIDSSDISQIAVLPLDTSKVGGGDSSSEWTIKLPIGESCEAVCLVPNVTPTDHTEPGYAVVATSRRFLRIFAQPTPSAALTRSSTCLNLFQITKLGLPPVSLPGCGVVAMASHPSQPILGIVVTSATGELIWRLFYLGGMMLGIQRSRQPTWLTESLITWQPLPISLSFSERPSSPALPVKLTWFGFSELGGLYTHDASGIVRRLLHGRRAPRQDYHWVPICDTRAILKPSNRRSDTYFIVGILESTEASTSSLVSDQHAVRSDKEMSGMGQLQAIYCKASKWPRVFPRPVICSLPFRLPLCSLDTDQGSLEDNYLRYLISEDWPAWGPNPKAPLCTVDAAESDLTDLFQSMSSKCVTKQKGVLLRLFALAAKLESDWASLAIARLMPDAATVQLAIRYAGRLRRQHLAHRLAGIALDKERGMHALDQSIGDSDDQESEVDNNDGARLPSTEVRESHVSTQLRSTRTRRYPSGSYEEDLTNVSLVSSATDDTHEEGHISGLPLPESETITQSFLSNTPSNSARNPFRDSLSNKEPVHNAVHNEPKLRARGSEVLDTWTPSSTASIAPTVGSVSKLTKKPIQANKKRAAPAPIEKRRSKIAKPPTMQTSEVGGFMDWFDTNRERLEEEYPEQSAEDLLHTAKAEYQKLKVDGSSGFVNRGEDKIDQDEKENKRTSKSGTLSSTKASKSVYANNASKRLSSFKFDSNEDN